MSFSVSFEELTPEWKQYIKTKCNIWKTQNQYTQDPEVVTIFKVFKDEDEKYAVLPFAMWKDMYDEFPNNWDYDQIPKNAFEGKPQETAERDQVSVLKLSLNKLQTDHYLFLALRTGFGKTFSAIQLICELRQKTVILCHISSLHQQWKDEFLAFAPALKVQIVKGKKLDRTADVYIMGIRKSSNFEKDTFSNIGTVVVDESHLTLTSTFSSALLNFQPKYLIGLSATPDRSDGMHKLLYQYFGPKKEFIVRTQVKDFTVIKYLTQFKPEVKYDFRGKLDWGSIVDSLSYNYDRQRLIADLCQRFSEHRIIILCKRVCTVIGCKNNPACPCPIERSEGIAPILETRKEDVATKVGSDKTHRTSARILIGTLGKLGVGFNDTTRNLLIMEADVKDVRQNEGRIRVDNNIVIDLVDSFKTLETHWSLREKWYIKRGANIVIEERAQYRKKLI